MENNISLLIKWLTESNVFNKDDNICYSTNNGYSWLSKSYKFIYHEITGYSISLFVYLYKKYNDEKYLKYAKGAAEYLLEIQDCELESETFGAFFHSYSLSKLVKRDVYYTFDNFIIINGFMHLYEETNEKKYLQASINCSEWLMNKMYLEKEHLFLARFDKITKERKFLTGDFAGDFGILNGKIAIPFLKLWRFTGNEKYKTLVIDLLNKLLILQRDDGSFWANFKKEYVFSHAQCYLTEGLIYAYHILKDEKYLNAVEKSLDFFRNSLIKSNDGMGLKHIYSDTKLFRKFVFKIIPYQTTDATSQYIRLVLLYSKIMNDKKIIDEFKLSKTVKFLLNNQVVSADDKNLFGSMKHKTAKVFGVRITSPINSTWCSQFTLQSLLEYDEQSLFIEENLF